MAHTYKTSEVANIIGIHPNTVRMYEDLELITRPHRQKNGYRVFTDLHIDQFRLARLAFEVEVLQNGLRKHMIAIIKSAACKDFDYALRLAHEYIHSIENELFNANEAITITSDLYHEKITGVELALKRKEVSDLLGISIDTLRNWEMNGLLTIKRPKNGYRVYNEDDIQKLKIIRSLRCANYSLSAILRLLNTLSSDKNISFDQALNTPTNDEDIISVCDKLIVSLNAAKDNATQIIQMLEKMKTKY